MSKALNKSIEESLELTFLSALYRYLKPFKDKLICDIDILLRSHYALLVGTLDAYLHRVVAERMAMMLFDGVERTKNFNSFKIPISLLLSLQRAEDDKCKREIFREGIYDIIRQNSYLSEKGVEGVATLIGINNIWSKLGEKMDAPSGKVKDLFNQIVNRRNRIVHELDYNKQQEREHITKEDVDRVSNFVMKVRACIEEFMSQGTKAKQQ